MMRESRLLVTIVLLAFIGFGSLWSPSPAHAEIEIDVPGCKGSPAECTDIWLTRTDEGITCVAAFGWTPCEDGWKARGWAISTAQSLFGDGVADGDMKNAYTHCAWIGSIATWHDTWIAVGIGINHENHNPNAVPDRTMDLANNDIGAAIGSEARAAQLEDMWGYVMNTCADMARNGELHGPCGPGLYVDRCPQF